MKRYATITDFHDEIPQWGPDILAISAAEARAAARIMGIDFIEVAEIVEVWRFPI